MNKLFFSMACLSFVLLTTGCAHNSNSWSPKNWFANRPRPLQNLFRGERCNTCNPPVGTLSNFGENVVGGCNDGNCGNVVLPEGQPVYSGSPDPGVPYYPSDLQSPMFTAPGPDMSMNSIQTNYPPTYSNSEFGSALQFEDSSFDSNMEIETPPMYGLRKTFN